MVFSSYHCHQVASPLKRSTVEMGGPFHLSRISLETSTVKHQHCYPVGNKNKGNTNKSLAKINFPCVHKVYHCI